MVRVAVNGKPWARRRFTHGARLPETPNAAHVTLVIRMFPMCEIGRARTRAAFEVSGSRSRMRNLSHETQIRARKLSRETQKPSKLIPETTLKTPRNPITRQIKQGPALCWNAGPCNSASQRRGNLRLMQEKLVRIIHGAGVQVPEKQAHFPGFRICPSDSDESRAL